MREKARSIKVLNKIMSEANTPEVDEQNRPVVNISVSDDSHFVSEYCAEGKPQLTQETASFLEHSIKHIKSEKQLVFKIKSSVIDEEEKVKYKRAIKNYYAQEVAEVSHQIRTNSKMSLIMVFVGIIVFVLNFMLSTMNTFSIMLSVLDVVAWVFVWEAVDIFFFRRHEIKSRLKKCIKLLTAEVEFV